MRGRYGSLSVRPASTRSRGPAVRPRSVVGLALAGLLGPAAAAADDALSLRMAPELGAAGPAQEVRGADLGLGARGLHWQILESRYRLRRLRGETEQLRGRLARHADTVAGLRALDRARDAELSRFQSAAGAPPGPVPAAAPAPSAGVAEAPPRSRGTAATAAAPGSAWSAVPGGAAGAIAIVAAALALGAALLLVRRRAAASSRASPPRDDAAPAAPAAASPPSTAPGPPRLRLVDPFPDVPAQQAAAPAASPARSSGTDAGTPSAHLRTVKIDATPRGVRDGDGVDAVFAAADALLSAAPRPAGAAGPGKSGNPASAAPGATPSTTRPKRPV